MNKCLLQTEVKPPVKIKLLQINSQELKNIKVSVKWKNVSQDITAQSLARSLDNPEDLILHKSGEGGKPIFDRDDVITNLEAEERIIIPISELHKYISVPIPEERQTVFLRNESNTTRSGNTKNTNRSKSGSTDTIVEERSCYSTVESLVSEFNSSRREESGERESKINDDKCANKQETISISSESPDEKSGNGNKSCLRNKNFRYEKSSQRRNYYNNKYGSNRRFYRTPLPYGHYRHNQTRDVFARYNYFYYPQEMNFHRNQYFRNAQYGSHSRFPYLPERYEFPSWEEYGGFRSRFPLDYDPSWHIYEPLQPYMRFITPENYTAPPLPRFPGYVHMTGLPPRRLPIYNNRPRI